MRCFRLRGKGRIAACLVQADKSEGISMKLAIASGKGGTGKTTVAVNLAVTLARQGLAPVLADCDVEEPNSHIFLAPDWEREERIAQPVPRIDHKACLGPECRRCIELCRFKALIWMAGEVMAFPELCHGCGLCAEACPAGAVNWSEREVGVVRSGAANGVRLLGGLMRVGEAMATPLIRAVKREAQGSDLQIWDCPPGTACPAVASLQGADAALLVTEPTPFGLHDLTLAVALVRELGLPFGVVINRAGMGDERVERYLERESIPLLASLPYSLEAAAAGADGLLLVDVLPAMSGAYIQLWTALQGLLPREVTA